MRNLSFKQFLELVEEPLDHISALKDELGIDAEDIGPQVLANFNLGKITYNQSAYSIEGLERDGEGKITGVKIKLFNDPDMTVTRKEFIKIGGKNVRQDVEDDKTYLIPIDDFNKMLTQGMEAGAAGGGMGGMPPM